MVPDRQKVWTEGQTDGRTEWTDGHSQNYIPPTLSVDNKVARVATTFLTFKSMVIIPDAKGQLTPQFQMRVGQNSNSS